MSARSDYPRPRPSACYETYERMADEIDRLSADVVRLRGENDAVKAENERLRNAARAFSDQVVRSTCAYESQLDAVKAALDEYETAYAPDVESDHDALARTLSAIAKVYDSAAREAGRALDEIDRLRAETCTGAGSCKSRHHIHGCYADDPCTHNDDGSLRAVDAARPVCPTCGGTRRVVAFGEEYTGETVACGTTQCPDCHELPAPLAALVALWEAVHEGNLQQIIAPVLKELYPQNPDVVLGREARFIGAAIVAKLREVTP